MLQRFGFGPGPDEHGRVRISELLAAFGELARGAAELDWQQRQPAQSRDWEKFKQLAEELSNKLNRYTAHPYVLPNELVQMKPATWRPLFDRMEEGFRPFYWRRHRNLHTVGIEEWHAVDSVEELFKRDLLDRVRRCAACNRWLFARKPDQESCSEGCRKKKYYSTDAYKRRRRENYTRKKQLQNTKLKRG